MNAWPMDGGWGMGVVVEDPRAQRNPTGSVALGSIACEGGVSADGPICSSLPRLAEVAWGSVRFVNLQGH
jgi:hypothetical protein